MHVQSLQTLHFHLRNIKGMYAAKIDSQIVLNFKYYEILGETEIIVKIFLKM